MDKPKSRAEMIKLIGGGIVVAAAALIMFPGFLGMAFGLLRIGLMIVVAGGACLLIAKATRKVQKLAAPEQAAATISAPTVAEQDISQ